MAKVLLTGSNGFAAGYVADALLRRRHAVFGLAKPGGANVDHVAYPVTKVDLLDAKGVLDVVADIRPDHVVHLAAISFVAHGDASEIYLNNVVGTRNLLEALAALGNFAGPALIVSSANVYGASASGQIDETVPAVPANDYGLSKLACEHLARIYSDRVPNCVVRPFNYTGVGQSTRFLIPKIVDAVRRGEPSIELGNLDVSRDFSDVRFFAEACVRLLECPAAIGEVVNICSGEAHSLNQIMALVARLSGRDIAIRVNPEFVRANDVKSLWGDPHKLTNLVGPVPAWTLQQTLGWMLQDSGGAPHGGGDENALRL